MTRYKQLLRNEERDEATRSTGSYARMLDEDDGDGDGDGDGDDGDYDDEDEDDDDVDDELD